MDEELLLLEEQMAAAQADLERLQTRLAEAETQVASRDQELSRLRRELESSRDQLSQRESAAAAEAEALRAAASTAAQRYRELALAREPELPADLVGGETVEEIDAALEQARQTVSQVRQSIESRAQSLRVPSGAPARGEADPGDLSPSEKIRFGLQQGH